MAEDKREQELRTVSSVKVLRGLDNNNESVLIAPADLPHPYVPVAYISMRLYEKGWYRLASGPRHYNIGAFLNIGNSWGYNSQSAGIYTLLAYNSSLTINKLDGYQNMLVDKIRYVHNPADPVSSSFIDIHYNSNLDNIVSISVSCITNLIFESTFEVAEIPSGYTTVEVNL